MLLKSLARELIRTHLLKDAFYVADMRVLHAKVHEWKSELPDVAIRYAVKCNPDLVLMRELLKHPNMGFDVASLKEMKTTLELGVKPDAIVFAHPCKRTDDLKFASSHGIHLTTFDSLSELHKIKDEAPQMECLLRIKVDNPSARVQLGLKYGAEMDEHRELVDRARALDVKVVGVAFHVGSFSNRADVFDTAIRNSRTVFEYAKASGFLMRTLDIGGGFNADNFADCAEVIRSSVKTHFEGEVDLIAEPGRFFPEKVFSFFVPVLGQRKRAGSHEYYVGDSLYGSMNCIVYDGQTPTFQVLRNPSLPEYTGSDDELDSVMHFSTCDSYDTFGKVKLPYLRNSDYLMIPDFGAYTLAGATDFNGINFMNPKIFYLQKAGWMRTTDRMQTTSKE